MEFDVAKKGRTVQCPHCGVDTLLFVPHVRPVRAANAVRVDPQYQLAPTQVANLAPFDYAKHYRGLIVTTGNEITGRTIESYLGVVRGITVRSPTIVQGAIGGFKAAIGGNIEANAEVCEQSRAQAYSRMVVQAKQLGADAIIAVRYDATEFSPNVTEVLAYGTAVKLND